MPTISDDAPMFLVVSYTTPHSPIEPLPQDEAQNAHIKNEVRNIIKVSSYFSNI